MRSRSSEDLLEVIYEDSEITPAEIIALRRAADAKAESVLGHEGREGILEALCKSFDVTNQLVQEVALRMRSDEYTDTGRAMVLDLIDAHIALNGATLRAFGS